MNSAASSKRKNLGRGLSALLGDRAPEPEAPGTGSNLQTLPIGDLHPCRFQPRRRFVEAQIKELAQSIREKGILQPLVVRPDRHQAGTFDIICGERRWRASQLAQLHDVPVVIRDFSDQEALEIALVENLQREDLTPLEEAEAYQRLKQEFNHTQEELADGIGKSRSHVANMIRLLSLPQPVKDLLDEGRLTAGHARALLGADDPVVLAKLVVAKGLNVRETEAQVTKQKPRPNAQPKKPGKDADTLALESDLTNALGLVVDIQHGGRGGKMVLHYRTIEQLDDLVSRLTEV